VAVLISLTTCPGTLAAVEIKDLLNSLDEQLRNAEHHSSWCRRRRRGERDIINAVPGRVKIVVELSIM